MEEFTRLLLECLEKELKSVNGLTFSFFANFTGREVNMRFFQGTRDGACQMGHIPKSEPEIFRTIKLIVPDTDNELSLNNLVHDNYAVRSDSIMMKCSDCCQHSIKCPQSDSCKLKAGFERKDLLMAPAFLYIQLFRFNGIHRKIESKVTPENILALQNGDKFELVSIGNHMGSLTSNGHYQALVKSGRTSWVKIDDDVSYEINLRDHITKR